MRKVVVKYYTFLFLITVMVFVCSCSWFGGTEYSRLVKKELATGKRNDSLFMGIYLRMPAKAFYGYCWQMNKKGLFTNGTSGISVMYKIPTDLKYPVTMNFFPYFNDDKITGMWANYEYDAWAPWNRNQFADSLLPNVVSMYKKWYPGGNDFIKITDKDKGTVYVKVDGNRRITIGQFNEKIVKVDYTDLLVEKKLKLKK
jgi:hypothetical protein